MLRVGAIRLWGPPISYIISRAHNFYPLIFIYETLGLMSCYRRTRLWDMSSIDFCFEELNNVLVTDR